MNYLIESSVCLAVFYGLYFWLFRKDTFFLRNRLYILGSLVIALIIPLMVFDMSAFVLSQEVNLVLPEVTLNATTLSNYTQKINYVSLIYWLGVIILAIRLGFQIFNLFRFIYKAPKEKKTTYTLVYTNGNYPTCSFGNYLLWNNNQKLSDEEASQIIRHETAHIKQKHTLDILFTEALKIVFWFNPVIYAFHKALSIQHEYLADAEVLQKEIPKNYGQLLVKQLFYNMGVDIVHNFNKSQIKNRIQMMNRKKQTQSTHFKALLIIPVLGFLLISLSCNFTETLKEEKAMAVVADQNPEPEIGLEAYFKYIGENLKYPKEARSANIEGTVFLNFVVDEKGNLKDFMVAKGLGHGCDEEVVRIVQNGPKWKPGTKNGKPVTTKMTLPVKFKAN